MYPQADTKGIPYRDAAYVSIPRVTRRALFTGYGDTERLNSSRFAPRYRDTPDAYARGSQNCDAQNFRLCMRHGILCCDG